MGNVTDKTGIEAEIQAMVDRLGDDIITPPYEIPQPLHKQVKTMEAADSLFARLTAFAKEAAKEGMPRSEQKLVKNAIGRLAGAITHASDVLKRGATTTRSG